MDTMDKKNTVSARPPARRRFALAVSAVAVAAVAVGSVAFLGGDDPTTPEQIAGGEPLSSVAMCVESYDLNTLGNREVAFDGTVVSIDGNQVTFDVNRWFTGGSDAETTLDANGLTGVTSLGGPGLEMGQRYLVSGSGGFVWACGFTMTYDTGIANTWTDVFAG